MSTLKDVLKSINHNKYSSASVLALTSLLVFRSTLAYLDYKGYGIESFTFNEAFENLAILGSFLVASVSTASTFYATKYSKERFHENMGIPFDLLYNYHNGMGHCPRAGFEIAAKDLGFEIPKNDPESMLRLLYSNVKTPGDITGYIRETTPLLIQELGVEKSLEVFVETTGLDFDLAYGSLGQIVGFTPKTLSPYNELEVN